MLSRLFHAHGTLCAQRPWEVIIGTVTLTVCILSMSLFTTNKVCGWNYACHEDEADVKSSDVIILTMTKCFAVMYVYLQFKNLRKLGSKYLLGIAGVFTIFSSFVFSIAVINLIGGDLTGLNEALPFFLLLVDLSKACALARFALSSKTQDEVRENIGRGMAIIGPIITLDAFVEIMVIGVGTLSGVKTLETMCCFGCLSVFANYLAFMTFYPAALTLVLELSRGGEGRPSWQLNQLSKVLEEEAEQKPNPVTQRVKIIMSGGLVLVHAHSRFVAETSEGSAHTSLGTAGLDTYKVPETPLWWFYAKMAMSPSLDYAITLGLAAVLALKYIWWDGDSETDKPDMAVEEKSTNNISQKVVDITAGSTASEDGKSEANSDETLVATIKSSSAFIIGGDDSSDDGSMDGADTNVGMRRLRLTSSVQVCDAGIQTDSVDTQTTAPSPPVSEAAGDNVQQRYTGPTRSLDECVQIMKGDEGPAVLSDDEIQLLVTNKHIPSYKLESMLGDHVRGVAIRRQMLTQQLSNSDALNNMPYLNYDYTYVEGACCENVLGYTPVPVGVAGPLLLDGQKYHVPMATTEGCLIASTNRGCRAIAMSSNAGAQSRINKSGMSRAPVVQFPTAMRASEAKLWMEDKDNFDLMAEAFSTTTRFGKLEQVQVCQAARMLYVRFVAFVGDAMGMNMVSKGSEKILHMLNGEEYFPDMEIMSLSGNYCTDKKPAAVNWLLGRGKSVVCEAVIPSNVVKTVLKTTVPALKELNDKKNLIGSAMAGSIGGYNAQAANIVTAIYIATGQDPAQNVASSQCLTFMEATGPTKEDLYISCSMPSIECGTIGGGTVLPPQAAGLEMLGIRGSHKQNPGANADRLARIVCATVMAGELSLMSALAAGHLVKSHLKHNRSFINSGGPVPTGIASSPSTPALTTFTPMSRKKSMAEPGTCTQKAP